MITLISGQYKHRILTKSLFSVGNISSALCNIIFGTILWQTAQCFVSLKTVHRTWWYVGHPNTWLIRTLVTEDLPETWNKSHWLQVAVKHIILYDLCTYFLTRQNMSPCIYICTHTHTLLLPDHRWQYSDSLNNETDIRMLNRSERRI